MKKSKNWYVVYTLPRWEKKVSAQLEEKGIEYYCPLNKVRKKWSDRYKIVMEPLFKGYVFVRPEEGARWDMKKIPGIINFIYWLGKPARVREEEIITIRKFLYEFHDVTASKPNLNARDEVVVTHGVFMNYKGIVLQVKGNYARVRIKSIGVELEALISKADLGILNSVELPRLP